MPKNFLNLCNYKAADGRDEGLDSMDVIADELDR
jgi:hypothetical protein